MEIFLEWSSKATVDGRLQPPCECVASVSPCYREPRIVHIVPLHVSASLKYHQNPPPTYTHTFHRGYIHTCTAVHTYLEMIPLALICQLFFLQPEPAFKIHQRSNTGHIVTPIQGCAFWNTHRLSGNFALFSAFWSQIEIALLGMLIHLTERNAKSSGNLLLGSQSCVEKSSGGIYILATTELKIWITNSWGIQVKELVSSKGKSSIVCP